MKSTLSRLIYLLLLFMGFPMIVQGQIFDINKQAPYQRVFIDTDNFDSAYLEILEQNWQKPTVDTVRHAMLHDLAYYWHTRNLINSINYTKLGLSICTNNPLWEGRFQIIMGAVLLRMEKLDSAFAVLEDAKSKVLESDLPFLNTQLGYVYERRGELDKAADFAQISMDLGKKLGDKKAMALAYSDLSNLFWKQSKFTKGLEYGLKSIELFEARGLKDLDYDFTLYVVGNNYLDLGDYENALLYFDRSSRIGEQYGFYNNLCDVYISLVELNTILGNFEEAETAGQDALKYAQLLENDFMNMRSWLGIGKMQIARKNYHDAIKSLSTCIDIATPEFGDEYFLSQAYEELSKAYAKIGNYVLAYNAMLKFDELEDRIFTAEADQRISELQTKYDVAVKESTIQQQESQLAQQRNRQIIISIIAGSFILFSIILYISFINNKKKNKLLEKQNKEKEFLLKEIHHRVKNNLEIVSSLLSLQSAQLTDSAAFDVMMESQNRVQSMSMIHQKLYQGSNLSMIEMKEYFHNLGNHVLDSFGMEGKIKISYKMKEIELDVDTAVPLGLIVNELLTNALKYAFAENNNGEIELVLNKNSNNHLHLEVSDNGIGHNSNGKIKGTGFGLQLINLLCQQLNGKMSQFSEGGTKCIFDFSIN